MNNNQNIFSFNPSKNPNITPQDEKLEEVHQSLSKVSINKQPEP